MASPSFRFRTLTLTLVVLVATGLLFAGCDAMTESYEEDGVFVFKASFGGLLHEAEGSGLLSLDELGNLQLSGEGAKGVRVSTQGYAQADLIFEPVGFKQSGLLSMDVLASDASSVLARMVHRAFSMEEAAQKQIQVDLSGLDASGMTVNFYQADRLLYQAKYSQISKDNLIGTTEDWPTSFHYISENGVTRIMFDYEKTDTGTAEVTPSGTTNPLPVSHVVITPVHPGTADWGTQITGVRLQAEGLDRILLQRSSAKKDVVGLEQILRND